MPKYNRRLRARLHDFAILHNGIIEVNKFLKEAKDDADFGLEQPISLNYLQQTLARYPEFIKHEPGQYEYFADKQIMATRWNPREEA